MEHLIANSGIQFITTEAEFNPSEPLLMGNGKTLKYSFVEVLDFITNEQVFDLLYHHQTEGVYIPLDELRQNGQFELSPNGREELDFAGLLKMKEGESVTLYSNFHDEDEEKFSVNSLANFRVKDPADGRTPVAAFELLLGHWLPMPMFEKESDGVTSDFPMGWCRVKIERIGEGSRPGMERFRLVWAFDTQLADDELSTLRPYFFEDEGDSKVYGLSNRADQVLSFMSSGDDFSAFSDYIYSLLGNPKATEPTHRHVGYYVYLVNFLRLSGAAPEVTLHNNQGDEIPVDMVLDIGNSRTCGVLFENGDFTKSAMLGLRDMTHPERVYDKSFDMRLVFRIADFGNDIVLDEDMFVWKSFVRVGDEAKTLVYRSLEEAGLSQKNTNHSSPKRYLWDTRPIEGRWENLSTIDDPYNVVLSKNVYVSGLSDMFDANGNYIPEGSTVECADSESITYSRSSLMTFVLIEIMQQAMSQINSIAFRNKHGNIDCRRVLRNIILTCPTAMPQAEQIKLRMFAEQAYDVLRRTIPTLGEANIYPTSQSVTITDDFDDSGKRMWSYDEATCCQLVYLYAEIAQRYNGEIHKFFELKGHVRPEDVEDGYEGKTLTIGSIDIGAGTSDLMICSYRCTGKGRSLLTPRPIYWDSFYLAGDDILRNIIQNLVIEGPETDIPDQGNIRSALKSRLTRMSNEELLELDCLKDNKVYTDKVDNIIKCGDRQEREHQMSDLAVNLVRNFFGHDSAMMSYKDRQCRLDFNTQISVPLAQFYLEMLRRKRPTRVYTFDEIFEENKPAQFLLDRFAEHFGFRFEELSWRFDPEEVSAVVKATLEPLMKQLSIVLYAYKCDIVLLAGRPTSLDAITELFLKYIPTSPDRLVRLNEYRVGSWFPTADPQGYFYDQKTIVAVGGMVGYLASAKGMTGFAIDFSRMIKDMKSTACYMGEYNTQRQQVTTSVLTPIKSTATLTVPVFPAFIGCKQLNSPLYQARPIYAIYNNTSKPMLHITVSRNYFDNREEVLVEEVQDEQGNTMAPSAVTLLQQSLVEDGKYWLDKGEFELSI